MENEVSKPSPLRRAESSARQVVLAVGLGMAAYFLGGFFSARLGEWLFLDWKVELNAGWALTVTSWVLRRVWLWLVLPGGVYALSRWTTVPPLRLGLISALSGETFSVLLVVGLSGPEMLMENRAELAMRLLTLLIGVAICMAAARAGSALRSSAAVKRGPAP